MISLKHFHKNTPYWQYQLTIFNYYISWERFEVKRFIYFRGNNFGKIIFLNRSLEFSLPKINN